MKLQILPIYDDIFKGEPMPLKKDLVREISSDAVIRACCHINASLHNAEHPLEQEKKVFISLLERIKDDKRRNLYYNNLMLFFERTKGLYVGIFPVIHVLKLIEESVFNYVAGTFSESTPEQDLSILKLLLIHNHEANEELKKTLKIDEQMTGRMYQLFWTTLLPTTAFLQNKDIIISLYKSIKFLNYLEQFKPEFLKEYLRVYGIDDKMKIVLLLFLLQAGSYLKEKDTYSSFIKSGHLDNNLIAQGVSFNLLNGSRNDFLTNLRGVRKYPLIKYENGDFGVTNWNFLIEKFYDGLVFDFFYKSGLNKNEANDFANYNKDLGTDFSNPLFMNVMSTLFNQKGIVSLREGERNKDCNYDYYIRIRNHVFLFEFKDVFFPIKDTYENIKGVIDTRLTGEKGVGQLIKQIEKLANTPNLFDEFGEFTLDRLFIYPIIVYTDSSFGLTGINHYLNVNFRDNLSRETKNKFFIINQLTLIHFDFFLERFDLFKSGEVDLVQVFNTVNHAKSTTIEQYQKFKDGASFVSLFDGFDIIANRKYPFKPKTTIGGTLYNEVIDSVTPFLAVG